MKLSRFLLSLIIIFFGYSCSFFNKPNFPVERYEFSGLRVVFADLEDSYKRSKNFNKIWSKIHKNRYRPYFRFAGKSYFIDGILNKYKQSFLFTRRYSRCPTLPPSLFLSERGFFNFMFCNLLLQMWLCWALGPLGVHGVLWGPGSLWGSRVL